MNVEVQHYPDFLGRDETAPAPLFVRIIAPTDLNRTQIQLVKYLKSIYKWDWVNPKLWSLIGLQGGDTMKFLEDYIRVSRELREELTENNKQRFIDILIKEYRHNLKKVTIYVNALIKIKNMGLVPVSVARPFDYKATTVMQDVTGTVAKTAGFTLKNVLPYVMTGGVLYLGVTTLAPNLLKTYIKK